MTFREKIVKIEPTDDSQFIVEKFVEEIGEAFEINASYFSNILMVLTELVGLATQRIDYSLSNHPITITFLSKPSGLSFEIEHLSYPFCADLFDNEEYEDVAFLVSTLSDHFLVKDKDHTIELLFKISSINYELSVRRREVLQSYFSVLNKEVV